MTWIWPGLIKVMVCAETYILGTCLISSVLVIAKIACKSNERVNYRCRPYTYIVIAKCWLVNTGELICRYSYMYKLGVAPIR